MALTPQAEGRRWCSGISVSSRQRHRSLLYYLDRLCHQPIHHHLQSIPCNGCSHVGVAKGYLWWCWVIVCVCDLTRVYRLFHSALVAILRPTLHDIVQRPYTSHQVPNAWEDHPPVAARDRGTCASELATSSMPFSRTWNSPLQRTTREVAFSSSVAQLADLHPLYPRSEDTWVY